MTDFPGPAYDAWLTTPPKGHYTEDGPEYAEDEICKCGHENGQHKGRKDGYTGKFHFGGCTWADPDEFCICDGFEPEVEPDEGFDWRDE